MHLPTFYSQHIRICPLWFGGERKLQLINNSKVYHTSEWMIAIFDRFLLINMIKTLKEHRIRWYHIIRMIRMKRNEKKNWFNRVSNEMESFVASKKMWFFLLSEFFPKNSSCTPHSAWWLVGIAQCFQIKSFIFYLGIPFYMFSNICW